MEFHKTNLHNFIKPADIKPKNDIDEVRSLNFIKNYVKENIQPITQKRKELFDKISARILEL